MKVLKFGGTSVGTVDSLHNVKKIVESLDEPAVVVVSALGGLTDKLIATANMAASGNDDYRKEMDAIRDRHFNVIEGVVADESKKIECYRQVRPLLDELHRLYDGVRLIQDLPEKTLDSIVSYGERISSVIVAAMVEGSSHIDSTKIVKTEKWFGKNIADTKLTTKNITDNFHPSSGNPIIAGGFISTDRDTLEITNLGRGGSDFTAALIAAALDASVLEIWTDVDGFMTSDPRIIDDARIIPLMSFVESMELCSFGAKVIYPPTIYPVFHKNIPIKILNTFNPEAPGTLIKDLTQKEISASEHVRGLSALKDITLFTIKGDYVKNVAATSSRAYNALARKGISIFLVSPTDDDGVFSFALRTADKEKAQKFISEEFAPEISDGLILSIESEENLSIVAIVGDNIRKAGLISPRINNTLQRAGIEPKASSEGASKTTVTFVVERDATDNALRLIHSLFF